MDFEANGHANHNTSASHNEYTALNFQTSRVDDYVSWLELNEPESNTRGDDNPDHKRSLDTHFEDSITGSYGLDSQFALDLSFPSQSYRSGSHNELHLTSSLLNIPPEHRIPVDGLSEKSIEIEKSLSQNSEQLTPTRAFNDTTPPVLPAIAPHTSSSPNHLSSNLMSGRSIQSHFATTRGQHFNQNTSNGATPVQPTAQIPQAAPEILRSRDVKARACDDCRKRKITCYILEGSNQCCRCQIENLDCAFTKNTATAGRIEKPCLPTSSRKRPTRNSVTGANGPLEDYSSVTGRSVLKRTLGLHPQHSSFFVGHAGIFEAKILGAIDLGRLGQAAISKTLSVRKLDHGDYFISRSHSDFGKWASECDAIEEVISPHGWTLAQTYFRFCQSTNPILHEEAFFEKLNRTHQELTPALMSAVYYLAARWWYHDNELCSAPRPLQLEASLFQCALDAFFRASSRPSLSLIQAGLLLQQCTVSGSYNLAISSIITSLSHRLALNKDCSQWKLPKLEKDIRHRLAWAVYAQSKWVSLIEAVPSQTQDSAWMLVPLQDENFETGGLGPFAPTMFIEMGKLSLLIGDIHEVLLANHPATSLESVLSAVAPILENLAHFRRNLPPSLHIVRGDIPAGSPALANHTIHLAIAAAEISLHRFIVSSSVDCPAAESKLKQACHKTASACLEDSLNLVDSLEPCHIQALCHFSCPYNITVIGVLAALLYTTTAEPALRGHYKACLRRLTKKLQTHRETEIFRQALQSLLASASGVPGLVELS